MGHKSINVRNRCMCFINIISQNATYRNQLLHSLYYVQTLPIARQLLFPGGAGRIVRKRLGLLKFTCGSWKLCVGSPTVSNFSKLVSTPGVSTHEYQWKFLLLPPPPYRIWSTSGDFGKILLLPPPTPTESRRLLEITEKTQEIQQAQLGSSAIYKITFLLRANYKLWDSMPVGKSILIFQSKQNQFGTVCWVPTIYKQYYLQNVIHLTKETWLEM